MPRARQGTVRYEPRKGCYQIKLTLNCGTRTPWFDLSPSVRSPNAMMRAKEVAKERTEIARDKDLKPEDFGMKPRQASDPATDATKSAATTMQDWVDEWTKQRKGRGLSTAAESKAVWARHIKATVTAHVRDWTRDDFRRLSRTLDETVQAQTLSWKTARNVWVVATKMVADAAGSKHDTIRVREDNP